MSSKQDILDAIRRTSLPPRERPSLEQDWIEFDDPLTHFAESVRSVGGECHRVDNVEQINHALQQTDTFSAARKICSLTEGIVKANFDLEALDDPHQTEDIDFTIAHGEFGVAENGAVWITDQEIKHRVVLFIAQHLVLIVRADHIVDNMHQAYDRLTFCEASFGVFISGPSKTADIEQSLVIGAHGPRSLIVYVVLPAD